MASALKYPFLDSDTLIEQLAGCTIADIFREEGEESFRELESQVLQVGARNSLSSQAVQGSPKSDLLNALMLPPSCRS